MVGMLEPPGSFLKPWSTSVRSTVSLDCGCYLNGRQGDGEARKVAEDDG